MMALKTRFLAVLIIGLLTGCQTGGGPIAEFLNNFGICVGETPEQIANC